MQSMGSRWLELIIVSNTILGLGWIVSREFSFWDGGVTSVAKKNESATNSVWATMKDLNCNSSEGNRKIRAEFASFLSKDQILARTENCNSYFKTYPILEILKPQGDAMTVLPLAFAHIIHEQASFFRFKPKNTNLVFSGQKQS